MDSDPNSSTPQARAARVRRLRNMANLSRQEMCEHSDIKFDTLIGWENARHGGLSKVGAKKVIDRVAQEGILSDLDWLLFDVGCPPQVKLNYAEVEAARAAAAKIVLPEEEKQRMIDELLLFKKHYPHALDLIIKDDAMTPQFLPGDMAAGVQHFEGKIKLCNNKICLARLSDGQILLRTLKVNSDDSYNLVATNLESQANDLVLQNVELVSVAPVIWHRQKNIEGNENA